MQLKNLLEKKKIKFKDPSWDFKKECTKYSTHGIHTYPAMMIPQISRRLIETYGKDANILLDPFMGSGTTLLEAKLHKNFKKAYGIDINPLALLLAKVKTTPLSPKQLKEAYEDVWNNCIEEKKQVSFFQKKINVPQFFNINFWFKPSVITDLTIIRNNINLIKSEDIKNFFFIAFSETVRLASNTKNGEFKLVRISEPSLKKHNPNVFEIFREKLKMNIKSMEEYFKEQNPDCSIHILAEDTRNTTSIHDEEVDLIVTSPPYGDSKTTVAYGQFSRLGLQWIGYDYEKVAKIDQTSLGGIASKSIDNTLPSHTLQKILTLIAKQDVKRAAEVLSFYVDFNKCVDELHRVTKKGAYLCFVVGNRTVKGVQIPTDEIMLELFQARNHYKHLNTFIRNIPNKRMPRFNSPTNICGNYASTMNEEWIVILRKD